MPRQKQPRTNLPPELTSFIGRRREVAEVTHLLSRVRLLTLTGVGGCGKTRLALRAAVELAGVELFSDGVCWLDLAPLHDPALVPQTVMETLKVREVPN